MKREELINKKMQSELDNIDLIIEDLQSIKQLIDDNKLIDYQDRLNYRWNLRVLVSQSLEIKESVEYVLNRFNP